MKKTQKTRLPKRQSKKSTKGVVEDAAFFETLERVLSTIAPAFIFGSHDLEDIKQQGRLYALELRQRLDKRSPKTLYAFLHKSLIRKFLSFKRDQSSRRDLPCLTCPLHDPDRAFSESGCREFADKEECDLFRSWYRRNKDKSVLADAGISINDEVCYDHEDDILTDIIIAEYQDLIDAKLDASLRADYNRILSKSSIPSYRREIVLSAVQKIIDDNSL